MDPNTSKDNEVMDMVKKRKKELEKAKKIPAFAGEDVTFEDIKPYVSMYKDEKTGKTVNDVLDKDGKSVFKTFDAKAAMQYLSQNFDKLKRGQDEAQEEAQEINSELDRIKVLANLS